MALSAVTKVYYVDKLSCHGRLIKSRAGMPNVQISSELCLLTARRYNLVSVTRRSIRAGSWFFSHEVVPVQGEYGAVFAVQVQNFMSITRVAVQV